MRVWYFFRHFVLAFLVALMLSAFANMAYAGDAGAAPGSASASAMVPTTPSVSAPTTPVDGLQHPKQALDSDIAAWRHGIPYGLVFALYLLAYTLNVNAKPGSWLDRGSLPTIAAAAVSVLAVVMSAMLHQIPWTDAIGAVFVAVGTALHNDPPKKAPQTKAV